MRTLETFALAYLLNSLWQVPVVFAAAWIAARAVRRIGPVAEHRVWVAAIILEALLPASAISQFHVVSVLAQLIPWLSASTAAHADIRITILSGSVSSHSGLHLSPHLLAAIALAYACSMAYVALRLLSRLVKARALHREAQRIVLTGAAAVTWNRCSRIFAVHNAAIAVSAAIACPATIGIRRRILLLPAHLPQSLYAEDLQAEDLDAAIAHEFAHMQRRDFAKNLFYTVLALPIAWHPLLWLTRARMEESREMVCDAMAANALAGSHTYAKSLLRLASLFLQNKLGRTPHAIGIFDANIFERRIMNLTQTRIELRGARRLATAAACIVLGLGTCASALALRMNVATPSFTSDNQTNHPAASASAPTEPTVISSKQPEFPADARAKKDKFDGTVIVALIVSKDGLPTTVVIAKSLRPDFDQSAIDAVKQYKFKPALLNGNPVEYPLTIYVNFQKF